MGHSYFGICEKNHSIGTLTLFGFDHFDKNVSYRITIPYYQTAPSTDDPHKIFAVVVEQHKLSAYKQWTNKQSHSISILSIFVGFYASDKSDGYVVPKFFL